MIHVPQVVLQQQHLILQIWYLPFHINNAYDAMAGKLQLISRAGTGATSSSSDPCFITFSFAPSIIFSIMYFNGTKGYALFPSNNSNHIVSMSNISTSFNNNEDAFIDSGSNGTFYTKKSSNGKTLYWYYRYSENNAFYSYNTIGRTYYFLGIA